MSKVHCLKMVQTIPASLDATWAFFSDPGNLEVLTPPSLHLKIVNSVFGDGLYPGQIMLYTVKPLAGLSFSWMTEITHVQPLRMFVDEQRKGPYQFWHHQHHFKTVEAGVEMTDLVHYRLPLGWLGDLFHRPLVQKKLDEIFTFRFAKIAELFGET